MTSCMPWTLKGRHSATKHTMQLALTKSDWICKIAHSPANRREKVRCFDGKVCSRRVVPEGGDIANPDQRGNLGQNGHNTRRFGLLSSKVLRSCFASV